MTFLETLQTRQGGLLHIKSELFWYEGRGWDGTTDRVCLILDAGASAPCAGVVTAGAYGPTRAAVAVALLLIDGAPQWIWVSQEDVEIL